MKIDSLIPFLLLWGIPAALMTREFLKMSKDDKQSALNDFL
ncbi:hypothetical protein ACOJQI_12285 [Bacillus salacetis]